MLHVERRGSGPRLLYCNGSGATLRDVRPLLNLLSRNFDLLAFDYRGMGASSPVTEPYTMADIATDVMNLLDDVGWDRTAVLGVSFGGMVAQEVAVTHPERIQRLALLCSSPGGAFSSFPLETLADLPAGERTARGLQLADRRWTADWPVEPAPAPQTEDQERGHRLQLQARKGHDVLGRLKNITCPTFVASGRYDDIAPVVNGRAIAERVPDATMHIYNGGHMFMVQDPTAWPEIIAFLIATR